MSATLACVDPAQVERFWPLAERFIASAYKHNHQSVPDELLTELRERRKLLWLAVDDNMLIGAIVTGIYDTIGGRTLKMLECGGESMPRWLHLHREIEDYAKAEGCGRVLIEGRLGWARKLEGYRPVGIVLEKRI